MNKAELTSRNTAETETSSVNQATFLVGIPWQGIVEEILRRPVRLISLEDNEASVGAITRGYSKKFEILCKTNWAKFFPKNIINRGISRYPRALTVN